MIICTIGFLWLSYLGIENPWSIVSRLFSPFFYMTHSGDPNAKNQL